jgi:uncharacterized protein YndB with AHSA1/START domain
MSTTKTYVKAGPDAVFDVLADPGSYAHWVVGSSKTREVDGPWPKPGSTFHHVQGAFGVGLKDTTSVIDSNRPRQIVLEVRARPFWVGKVEMRLSPSGDGTHVTMIEYPVGGIVKPLHNAVLDRLLHIRNVESLRRLRKMAEKRASG